MKVCKSYRLESGNPECPYSLIFESEKLCDWDLKNNTDDPEIKRETVDRKRYLDKKKYFLRELYGEYGIDAIYSNHNHVKNFFDEFNFSMANESWKLVDNSKGQHASSYWSAIKICETILVVPGPEEEDINLFLSTGKLSDNWIAKLK